MHLPNTLETSKTTRHALLTGFGSFVVRNPSDLFSSQLLCTIHKGCLGRGRNNTYGLLQGTILSTSWVLNHKEFNVLEFASGANKSAAIPRRPWCIRSTKSSSLRSHKIHLAPPPPDHPRRRQLLRAQN